MKWWIYVVNKDFYINNHDAKEQLIRLMSAQQSFLFKAFTRSPPFFSLFNNKYAFYAQAFKFFPLYKRRKMNCPNNLILCFRLDSQN